MNPVIRKVATRIFYGVFALSIIAYVLAASYFHTNKALFQLIAASLALTISLVHFRKELDNLSKGEAFVEGMGDMFLIELIIMALVQLGSEYDILNLILK